VNNIKHTYVFTLTSRYFLSDFNQPDFSQKYLIAVLNIKFYGNPSSVSLVMSCCHTNGWTDRCDNANSQFL